MTYRFVEQEKATFPVATMCRVLEVSSSGFWAWSRRPPSARARSDAELTRRIRDIHEQSRGTFGAPASTPSSGTAASAAHASGSLGSCATRGSSASTGGAPS